VPYLKLVALATGRSIEAREPVVRLGRDPGSTIVFSGDEANVVSARHAEVRHTSGGWHLVDLGSRNGTLVNGARVTGAVLLQVGDKISLGDSGPKLSVAAVTEEVAPTVAEHPAIEMRAYAVSLLHAATGRRHEGRGTRIRLGRGRECEVQLAGEAEAIVSRVHAELTIGPSGGLMIRDAGSKNGTFVNGDRVTGLLPVRLGDHITLGRSGPVLIVEGLGTAPMAVARPPGRADRRPLRGMIGAALTRAREERRRGGRRSTAFLRALAAEMGHDSRRKLRWLAALTFVLVLLLGGAVYAVYWLLSGEVAATAAQQRSAEDSTRAEAERLRQELAAARAAAAPAARVDSLRAQLESAQARTAELRAEIQVLLGPLGAAASPLVDLADRIAPP